MPEESLWATFFTPEEVLHKLGLPTAGDVVDFGCGYGTFTIPAAKITSGTVHAWTSTRKWWLTTKRRPAVLPNVRVSCRDFVADGTGLPDSSVAYVMLFNILHAECPDALLREAYRVLSSRRQVGHHPLELRPRHATRSGNGHPPAPRTMPRVGRIGRIFSTGPRNHRPPALPLRPGSRTALSRVAYWGLVSRNAYFTLLHRNQATERG